MWDQALNTLHERGTVEYGAYQRDTQPGTPLWRRPVRGKRFESVENALFNQQGARNACLGVAPYPKERYANTENLFMPYAAAWLRDEPYGFLVRQSSPNPEAVVISSELVDVIHYENEQQLVDFLASLFGEAAREYSVRFLTADRRIVEA